MKTGYLVAAALILAALRSIRAVSRPAGGRRILVGTRSLWTWVPNHPSRWWPGAEKAGLLARGDSRVAHDPENQTLSVIFSMGQ